MRKILDFLDENLPDGKPQLIIFLISSLLLLVLISLTVKSYFGVDYWFFVSIILVFLYVLPLIVIIVKLGD